jgi:Ankyrin repeat
MSDLQKIIVDFELHSVEGIRSCFENGVDPNATVNDQPLIYELITMYSRGPLFKECIRAFVDYGLVFDDKPLLAVLLDDAAELERLLQADKKALSSTWTFNCTFTPLLEVSLLHICAEYNHRACAEVLVRQGADINARAGLDANGFGGQTPVFHTVNQHDNSSIGMLQFLLAKQADLSLTVKGLIWGRGYEWETFIPAVNPISYAMMGLLRQFQRTEEQIYEVVALLLKAAYGIDYHPANIPNKYLAG